MMMLLGLQWRWELSSCNRWSIWRILKVLASKDAEVINCTRHLMSGMCSPTRKCDFGGRCDELEAVISKLRQLWLKLADCNSPLALVHGDLMLHNTTYHEYDMYRYLLFNWEYVFIGHPLFDFHWMHEVMKPNDVKCYLSLWSKYVIEGELDNDYEIAKVRLLFENSSHVWLHGGGGCSTQFIASNLFQKMLKVWDVWVLLCEGSEDMRKGFHFLYSLSQISCWNKIDLLITHYVLHKLRSFGPVNHLLLTNVNQKS